MDVVSRTIKSKCQCKAYLWWLLHRWDGVFWVEIVGAPHFDDFEDHPMDGLGQEGQDRIQSACSRNERLSSVFDEINFNDDRAAIQIYVS